MPGWKKTLLAGIAVLAISPDAAAAPLLFDFTAGGGVLSGSGHAMSRSYTAGGVTLTVSGLSLATLNGSFAQASVGQWNGAGLGVCNASEGLNCSAHQVDNSSGYDLLLLRFDEAVIMQQAVVQTYSSADTDVSYFLGNVATPLNLTGQALASLSGFGFGAQFLDTGSKGSNTTNTVSFGDGTFNALLIGARLGESNDAFKLRGVSVDFTAVPTIPDVAVPAPAALALFATGLVGLALVAGRRRDQPPSASSTMLSVSS